ncbi:SusC/RagA family TonB-linked outer membrane protein [Sphingobacterium spiritivorum]|uniref:SusC/RagA family TonB-linked outer membrane protein n=1 Tax=Sphingobacterium spiritivorum TaxID=258 RepID=UPI003DA52F9D
MIKIKKDGITRYTLLKLIVILSCLSGMTSDLYAQISLDVKSKAIKEILKDIEQVSNYKFFYSEHLKGLDKASMLKVSDASIDQTMKLLLEKTSITYNKQDKNIIVLVPKDGKTEIKKQVIQIKGTIQNTKKDPIPGASITVPENSGNGTSSDAEGHFSIETYLGTTLRITSVGYAAQEVKIINQNPLHIIMEISGQELSEVVVVGYGTLRKSDVTGSVASVKASELTSAPSMNAGQALQGRAAGVMVQNSTAAPSGDVTIRIRGANSLTYGNDPLVIIDGVQGGSLGSLNPNDIESMEVLKDAAALSIYGSRGANGVIIVTTKTGKSDSPQISYNSFYAIDQVRRKLPSLNAQEYARLFNEAKIENGQNPIDFTNMEFNTNWQDEIFRKAFSQNQSLTISGTKNDVSYFLSGNLLNKQGVVLNTDYLRYSLRSNFKIKATSRLTLNINSFLMKDNNESGDYSSAIVSALQWSPTKSVYDNTMKGKYTQPGGGVGPVSLFNPVGYAQEIVDNRSSSLFTVAPSADFKITDNLKFTSLFAYKTSSFSGGYFDNQIMNNGPAADVYGSSSKGETLNIQNTNILTFDKKFGDHTLTVTGVYEILKDKYTSQTISARGIPVALGYDGVSFGAEQLNPKQEIYNTAMRSVMGRVNYNYKNRYLLSFSDRYDGASQLSKGNKFDNFFAASIGWNMMEESFMKSLKNSISDFKWRASYGAVGNAAVPAYSSLMKFNPGIDAQGNATLTLSQLANSNLRWERTTESNVGFDANFLAERLSLTAEYYNKKTEDLLMWQKVPSVLGVETKLTNVGAVSNKGFDIALGGTPIKSDKFNWSTTLTGSYNKNKILALDGFSDVIVYSSNADFPGLVGSFVQMVGQPMGTFLGYKYIGVWKESEKTEAAVFGSKPGDAKYADLNRDGKINNSDIDIIGNAQPKWTFGWNNTFRYRDFEFNFFWQGVVGNKIYNQNRVRRESYSSTFPTHPVIAQHWTPENQNTDIPAFSGLEYRNSSRWVENGDYLRLKSITLNYFLPKHILKSTKFLREAKIYFSGSNLLTLTSYKGFDPEASMGKDATAAGVDRGIYPSAKGFIFGLDLTF